MSTNDKQIVTFSPEGRDALVKGVNTLANAVKATLGPKGRNVVIETPYGEPTVTKDGVTVARQINLEDPKESLGADIIKQAASKSAKAAGDGTTTATVLAQSLVNEGVKLINQGISPIEIKRMFEAQADVALAEIQMQSQPVTMDNVLQIATISANNDPEIGKLIHQGFEFVGMAGMMSVEDSKTGKTYVKTVDGTSMSTGLMSPYFVTDPVKMEAVYENPLILITDKKIRTSNEIVPALTIASNAGRPLVVIADDIDAAAISLLVVNRARNNFPVIGLRAPGYGERRAELLKDYALITGAELISETKALRLEDVTIDQLGSTEKIISNLEETILIAPKCNNPEEVQSRIEELRLKLEDPTLDSYTIEKLNQRVAALTGKVAVLNVGAPTETELKEKKDRIDDALRATKCAIQMGYVEGSGVALARAAANIKEEVPSKSFVTALLAPYNQIMENANLSHHLTFEDLEKDSIISVNALTGEEVDLIEAGVIDPTLVVTEAISNAVSAANMIILSEVVVHNVNRTVYDPREGTGY